MFSHDKNYLHILYIDRFTSFPSAKDIFKDPAFPYPSSPSSSLRPSAYKNVTYDSIFPLPVSSSKFPPPCESHCL